MLNCKKNNALPEAINLLTDELRKLRQQKARHFDAVTKADLDAAKAELLKAIGEPGGITPCIEAAVGKTQDALDNLDAQVDDLRRANL